MRNEDLFVVLGYGVRMDDLWVVLTAACSAAGCALVGCFLVLRRMALLGDAISHAVLPGLAAAFILTGTRDPLAMAAGAMVVGVMTALLSAGLHRFARVHEDASMGVVFTTLFAIGVLMITWVARDVDLDPGCVLYGLIEFVPFDTVGVAGAQVPRALLMVGGAMTLSALLIAVFYKELKITSFDPMLATSMGISAGLVQYGLMGVVGITTVASFEAVGSVLVVSMLAAPAATAQLLTDRLSRMLALAVGAAVLSAVAGYVLAVWLNTSVAGAMSGAALLLFVLAVLGAPRHGVIAKRLRRLGLSLRICAEDILGALFRAEEFGRGGPILTGDLVAATGSGALGRAALLGLRRAGLIVAGPGGRLALSPAGRERARHVVRGHRLWEAYLAARLNVDPAKVHKAAHQAEHHLSPELRGKLSEDVATSTDPHGRVIP